MVRKLAGTLATVGMLSSPLAFALGLGEAELLSSLNQPFKATIQLAQTDDVDAEDIRVQLADERAFAKAGLDRQFFLENLSFSVISGGNGPYIELTSSKPVREPFLNFLLAVEWPQGQLMREYTFLIDPPTYSNASASSASVQSSSGVQAGSVSSSRTASPVASMVEEGAHRIKVGPTDTLWSLARKNRPDSDITIKQAMLGIQDANPDAFPTGNINNMEAGSTILIPNRSAMMSRTGPEAIREVARQNKAWVAFKAQSVPATAKKSADSQSLKLVADTEQQAADSDNAKVSEELALSKESLDQSNREKAELSGRLDELQKQVSTLQKLIRLKDEQLAAMEAMLDKQNKLLSGKSVAESDAKPVANDSMAISSEPPVATTASAAVTGQVNAGAIGLDLAAKAEAQAEEVSEQSETATEQDVQPEPVESFSLDKQETTELDPGSFLVDSLRKNATIIGGAAAAILALILLLVVMRRRKAASKRSEKQKNSDDSDLSDLATGAAAGAAGVAALDAISNDDLPDDLSLDDDLSGDLDESSLSEIEMDLDSAPDELNLDDLGEPDVQAESSSAEIEDLGDFDLGDLGDDLETDSALGDREPLGLDDDLDLDDLDFSEDFDLGDLDDSNGDDETGELQLPFVQAESTVNTELAVDADSGESVQDNLIESGAERSVIMSDDAEPESEALDDLELEGIAETGKKDADIQVDESDEEFIDLEGDDLSDLELSEIDDVTDLSPDASAIDTQEQTDDELLAALADDAAAQEAEKLALESERDLSVGADSDDSVVEPALPEADNASVEQDDSEEVDNTLSELNSALDEAQSYRELGQPEQAAAILQRSLGENPEDNDVRLKFMEVLVDLGDEATFDHELRQLQNAADAKALSEALTLQQELYNKTGASHYVAEPSAADEVDDLDDIMPLDDKATSSESADADYDVDLNSELDALERDFERYAGEESSDERLDLDDIDFELMDLDLSDDIEDDKPMINLDPLEFGAPEPLDSDDFELTELADLDSDDLAPFSIDESDADYQFNDNQQALRTDAKDYIDDLGDLSMSTVNEPDAAEPKGMEDLVSQDLSSDDIVDLSPSIDDDLDDLADLGELSDISFDDDGVDEQLNIDGLLDENEDPEIKLDLARAYVDMGNTASAIEALEDVLRRGSTEQKHDASELIAKLQGDA